jgi:hypothetical protein
MPDTPLVVTGSENIHHYVVASAFSAAILTLSGIPVLRPWQKRRVWEILAEHGRQTVPRSRQQKVALLRVIAPEFPIIAQGLERIT